MIALFVLLILYVLNHICRLLSSAPTPVDSTVSAEVGAGTQEDLEEYKELESRGLWDVQERRWERRNAICSGMWTRGG
jgi:hypothetical protein